MTLDISHYSTLNGSGMAHVAQAMAEAEGRLGHRSRVVNIDRPETWDAPEEADIHVIHTHFPDVIRRRVALKSAVVFVAHGTPEHVVENAIDAVESGAYAPADGWMLLRQHLRATDAVVTFWPRHQAIYQSMVPKERTIHCVPLGVDTAFWAGGEDKGRFAGSPSVWMSENQHRMKWALDVLIAWPWVAARVPDIRLHAHYIPHSHHRFFIDLANSNGAAFTSFLSGGVFPHDALRSMWKSLDFFLGPVRYGDFNCLSMQAAAAGLRTISYRGNPYADFWITEGDQRQMATDLAGIFLGETEPRTDKLAVPDLADMGAAMVGVYEGALDRVRPAGYVRPPRAPVTPPVTPPHVRAHFAALMARSRPAEAPAIPLIEVSSPPTRRKSRSPSASRSSRPSPRRGRRS